MLSLKYKNRFLTKRESNFYNQKCFYCLNMKIAGPQKEVDQWPLFFELGCLLPHTEIELHFIGPHVPDWAHGCSITVPSPQESRCGVSTCSCSRQRTNHNASCIDNGLATEADQGPSKSRDSISNTTMALRFWKGDYHTVLQQCYDCGAGLCPPEIVVGCNAGLAAYPGWVPSLRTLYGRTNSALAPAEQSIEQQQQQQQELKSSILQEVGLEDGIITVGNVEGNNNGNIPLVCVFTDYNEEVIWLGEQMIQSVLDAAALGDIKQCINPFRQPFLLRPHDNKLPTMSNGFALILSRS